MKSRGDTGILPRSRNRFGPFPRRLAPIPVHSVSENESTSDPVTALPEIGKQLKLSSAQLQYKEQPMDTNFPADSPESRYLSQAIDKQIQALEKSGAPRVSAPATGPKKDLTALVAEEKEKWGLA